MKVIAGVFFFRSPSFDVEEPTGKEGQRLVMMPAQPIANFVVRQARLPLATLKTLFHAKFRFRRSAKFGQRGFHVRVAQIVIRFDYRTVTISVSNDNQQFPARCF